MLISSSSGQAGRKTSFLEVYHDGKFVKYHFVASTTLNDAFPERCLFGRMASALKKNCADAILPKRHDPSINFQQGRNQ